MSLRDSVRTAVEQGSWEDLERLVAGESRALRHILGMTYRAEEEVRVNAARAVAIVARHHPKLVQDVVRRFVWAMNDESGTNAVAAPVVLRAIAEERPDLLLAVAPDLVRLSADPGLREGLAQVLGVLREKCPGETSARLGDDLNRRG